MIIAVEQRASIALVTLSRPPANAINHAFMTELCALLPRLSQQRAVVLTGSGSCFCAGLDLNEVFSYPEPQSLAFAAAFDDAVAGLFSLPVPVVAAINGHAIAGGCVLAAACDFRLMADGKGRVGLPEIQVGVPFPTSALEAVRCRCAGPHLYEVLQRGQTYLPGEALARNLIDQVVPQGELLDAAIALAEELAGRPRVAFSTTKQALRADHLARMAAARQGGVDPLWQAWRTEEVLSAMAVYKARTLSKRA